MAKSTKLPPIVGVLLGISCYELSDTVLFLVEPLFFPTLIRILGLVITVYYLSKGSYQKFGGNISTVFTIMVLWSIFMLMRGSLIGNYIPGGPYSIVGVIRRSLINSFGAFAFFLPLISTMKVNLNSLYYLKRYAVFFCLISLIMTFMARDQIAIAQLTNGVTEISDVDGNYISVRALIHAAFPGFGLILFALFCNGYINSLTRILFPVAIFAFFVVMAIGGGRGDTIFNLVYLLLFFYLMIRFPVSVDFKGGVSKNKKIIGRLMGIAIGAGFVFLLVYMYSQTEIFDYVLERAFGGKTLSTDVHSESRNILVNDFTNDFNNHPLDWVWGRGVNGSYATQHLGINGRRAWMEWGYLYLVLKGGFVYLFLFVFCFLHAAYLGFLRSKNSFSKGLACMCIVILFDLASTNAEPQYTTQFVLSWICFGLLERREIRMMSDADIYGYFNIKNYKA